MAKLMSHSRMSLKIKLCQHIRTLNDEDKVQEMMQQMQEQLNCSNTKEFLIKVLMCSDTLFTNKALKNMTHDKPPLSPPPRSKHTKGKYFHQRVFPFLKMPQSIQQSVAMFMDEKSLLKFEKCCRSTYTLVNTASFLRQSPNFKSFKLGMTNLNAILRDKVDCYKFSYANQLSLVYQQETDFDDPGFTDTITTWKQETKSALEIVMNRGREDYLYQSNWFSNMLKSLTTINCNWCGSLLLDCIPFNFATKLQKMTFNGYWEESIPFASFIDKYSNHFAKQQPLEFVRERMYHLGGDDAEEGGFDLFAKLNIIAMKHLKLHGSVNVNIKSFGNDLLQSHLRVLSLESVQLCDDGSATYDKMKIDTLRLKYISWSATAATYMLNQKLIEKMNWQRTLKNLTFECRIYATFETKIIESILQKKYLYNLENVNILFKDLDNASPIHDEVVKSAIDQLFNMLIENRKLLKYQFKQLNFGYLNYGAAFEWSVQTDETFLNNEKKMWQYKGKKTCNFHANRMLYSSWKKQWCDGYY